jgi:hypothetical protein
VLPAPAWCLCTLNGNLNGLLNTENLSGQRTRGSLSVLNGSLNALLGALGAAGRHVAPLRLDRFWRGRDAQAVARSGVGLVVAAELAPAHHGQLTAGNAPNGGAPSP